MVEFRPTLIQNYVNLLYMLGTSKTLNTSEQLFYCNKVKDITMSNQQVTKAYFTSVGTSETAQEGFFIVLGDLPLAFNFYLILDKNRGQIRAKVKNIIEKLRYSPTNIKFIYLSLNKYLKIKLSNLTFAFDELQAKLIKSIQLFSTNSSPLVNNLNNSISSSEGKEINPYWITGFTDAEGCFSVIIEISDTNKWKIRISFEINLHFKDVDILYKIKDYFGVGTVYLRANKNIAVYRVSNIQNIKNIIIPHFKKYPLISQKEHY